jgi:hypothetical protein
MKKTFFGLLAMSFILCLSNANHALAQSAIEFFADPADTVIAPDSDSLDIDGTEFTMEAWVFPTGTQIGNGNEGIIINKEDSY